VTFIKK